MSDVKGVLFDLDNTLIDWSDAGDWGYSERKHLDNIYHFLADHERPLSCSTNHFALSFRDAAMNDWEEARTTVRAPHIIKTMQAVLAKFGFEPDEHISMNMVMEAYDWGIVEGVKTFPDVPPALQKLIDDDIKIGIVTNAWQPMWMRDPELKYHNLLQYFPEQKLRISAADVGYLKPHPTIFMHALKQLGTKAENTLFVGDNPVADISGAQQAGMRAILRVNGDDVPRISDLIVPDATINSFDKLLLIVDDWDAHS